MAAGIRERRRAEDHEPARLQQIRRHFQRHMAAEAPADEPRLRQSERIDGRADRTRMTFERIGAVLRVVRRAVPRQVDRDQPEALAEATFELAAKGARR